MTQRAAFPSFGEITARFFTGQWHSTRAPSCIKHGWCARRRQKNDAARFTDLHPSQNSSAEKVQYIGYTWASILLARIPWRRHLSAHHLKYPHLLLFITSISGAASESKQKVASICFGYISANFQALLYASFNLKRHLKKSFICFDLFMCFISKEIELRRKRLTTF